MCFAALWDPFLLPPPTRPPKNSPKPHSHGYLLYSCALGHLLLISSKIKNPIVMYTHLYPYSALRHFYKKIFPANIKKKELFTCCALWHFYKKNVPANIKKIFLANIKKILFTCCALRRFYKKNFLEM